MIGIPSVNVHRSRNLAGAMVSNAWISIGLFQPLLAVWFFPSRAAYAAIRVATTPAAARNLAGGLYRCTLRPFDRWWRCPTFIGQFMGDNGLRQKKPGWALADDGDSHFVRRHLGIVVEATGKIIREAR